VVRFEGVARPVKQGDDVYAASGSGSAAAPRAGRRPSGAPIALGTRAASWRDVRPGKRDRAESAVYGAFPR